MSTPCAVVDCGRVSRALCHCCKQNLCRDHLNAHDDQLNDQLNPIADELNQLSERLNHLNSQALLDDAHKQLEEWRDRSHQLIEEYFHRKELQLTEYATLKIHRQAEHIDQLKVVLNSLVQRREATVEDHKSISATLQSLREEISDIESRAIPLNIQPIEIDESVIEIGKEVIKGNFDFAKLAAPVHTINRPIDCSKPLATNDRVLLMHNGDQLCLLNKDLAVVRSLPWTHGWTWDICWSPTLSRFIIITLNDIFLLNENNLALERIRTDENLKFSACTCSKELLYVSTNELGSSVCEFSLRPAVTLVKRWQSPDLCRAREVIQDIVFHERTLAMLIGNHATETKRLDLRVAKTFELLWTLPFEAVDPQHNLYRLCAINGQEWLVADWRASRLLHVTKDGKLKHTCPYEAVPYRCCQFGSDLLVVSTRDGVNVHRA